MLFANSRRGTKLHDSEMGGDGYWREETYRSQRPPHKPRTKRVKSTETEEGSVVATVDKAALLAMVDQLESEAALEEEQKQQVLTIAHDEDVSWWIEAIAQWLRAVPRKQVSFQQLCQSLGMPSVEVWLGLLLGEFELEQGEDFYSDTLWAKEASIGVG